LEANVVPLLDILLVLLLIFMDHSAPADGTGSQLAANGKRPSSRGSTGDHHCSFMSLPMARFE
jgi:hypothetical protein